VPDLCERLRVDAQAFLREPDETLAPGARSRLRAPAKQPPVGARSRALCFTRSGARERKDAEAGSLWWRAAPTCTAAMLGQG
jgi:hypothetical protein